MWWIRPSSLLLYFIIPLYLLVCIRLYSIDFTLSGQATYKIPSIYMLGFLSVFLLWLGAYIGERIDGNKIAAERNENINKVMIFLFVMSFIAYVIWFIPIISNFSLIKAMILGVPGTTGFIRQNYSTIPGVTTIVQFSIVYSACYGLWGRRMGRKYTLMFYLLLALALLRAVLWSERLAVIEYIIPYIIVVVSIDSRFKNKWYLNFAPYAGIVFLILYFVAFEYSRSWISYYIDIYDSIWQFGLDRFLEYYFASINNSVGLMDSYIWPSLEPKHTLSFLFNFPVLGGFFSEVLLTKDYLSEFLYLYGDPEFNNTSGVLLPVFEWGYIAYFFTFMIGYGMGRLYTNSSNSKFSLLAYACFYIGLLEVLRLPYYGEGRFFAVLIGLLIVFFFVKKWR